MRKHTKQQIRNFLYSHADDGNADYLADTIEKIVDEARAEEQKPVDLGRFNPDDNTREDL
jgi:hypothetical protein